MPQRKEKRKETIRIRKNAKSVSVLTLVRKGLFNLNSNGRHHEGKDQ